ncbi:unnamed protein product [Blepharisma stoltei]|uniref:Replication factor A protein 3 n=1 Tax=Blepharisma stoltei TaxID=1481888 RepID=A0AAU9IV37_9CILI|nr:unnamed protein product [Blepharisma stoltei]
MAQSYPTTLGKDLTIGRKVSVVGKVEGTHENGIYIADDQTHIKIHNIPITLNGIVEVRGIVNAEAEIYCESYNQFEDFSYNFEAHSRVIELYKDFPALR